MQISKFLGNRLNHVMLLITNNPQPKTNSVLFHTFKCFPFRVEHIKYRLPIQNIRQIPSYPHWKSINVWVCCLIEELLSLIILQSRYPLLSRCKSLPLTYIHTQIFSFYLIFHTKPKLVLHTLIPNRFSVPKVLITIFGLLFAVQNQLQIICEVRS